MVRSKYAPLLYNNPIAQQEIDMKRKQKFLTWFSVFCIVFPRIFVSYALYGLPSLLAVKFTYKKTAYLFLSIFILAIFWVISSQVANIAITGFALAIVLQLPFFLFLLEFDIKEDIDCLRIVRLINISVFIFSLINMTQYGFPFKWPYVNFLPDFFSAFYAQGGAKIITIIGMFGFAAELFVVKEKKRKFWFIIALLNFLVPNYLIGIIMGLGALGVVGLRKKPALIPLLVLIILIMGPYADDRYQALNTGFAQNTGMNPKVFAYYSILLMYSQFPTTILFGTGLGGFSSTPALWASTYISSLSTHDIPKLPGLFMSQYHQAILGPILSILVNNKWSLESSASKPYTSVSSIFTEYGLIIAIIIMILAFYAFKAMGYKKKYTLTIACFAVFIFTTDQWHDSLFFGYMLLLSKSISNYTT